MISIITSSLERINDKLDKHDDKFDAMSDALRQLIKVDTETKENREAIGRAFRRIEALEHDHVDKGCVKCREIDGRHIRELEKARDEHKNFDDRIKILENKPKDNMDLIKKGFLGAVGVGAYTWLLAHFKGG